MISLKNINLSFADRTIFRKLDWTIPEGSRIGIVGDNGSGKTTLFRVILGFVEADDGLIEISKGSGHSIGYLPQDLAELEPISVMAYLRKRQGLDKIEITLDSCKQQFFTDQSFTKVYEEALLQFQIHDGYAFESRARQVLKGLGFAETDAERSCAEFSGGWKMRILLSSILLSNPNIMMLDEPTNHLDTESMEWLEFFLKGYTGTLLAISHDRMFLDKLVSQIVEVEQQHLIFYRGNYSHYLSEKARRMDAQTRRLAQRKKSIQKTSKFIERFRYKATKARQVQSRIKMLERTENLEISSSEKSVAIKFPDAPKSGREVLSAKHLSHCYGSEFVFRNLNFVISRGEKIALVGVNGAGKSTLTRLLSKDELPAEGEIHHGLDVKLGFFSQESARNLNYSRTVWEEIFECSGSLDDQERRNLLGAFLFSGDEIMKTIAVLSGGEKSRLALLKLLLNASNLLILDEPTNHLDLQTKRIFQNALLRYRGTVIIVSHDRDFLDRLVNRVIELRDGKLMDYPGNYSYFIEKRHELSLTESSLTDAVNNRPVKTESQSRMVKENKRIDAEERNRLYRLRSSLKKDLAEVESSIMEMERKKKENENILCQPDIYRDPTTVRRLQKELKDIDVLLKLKYIHWDDLTRHLETL